MVQLEQRIRVRDARISELEQIIQTKGMSTQMSTDSPHHLMPTGPTRAPPGKDYLCKPAGVEESPSLLSPSLYDHTDIVQSSTERQPPSSKIRTNPFVSNKRRSGGGLNSSVTDSPEVYKVQCNGLGGRKGQDFNFNAMYGMDSRSSSPLLFRGKAGETYTVNNVGSCNKSSDTYTVKSKADSTNMAKTETSSSPDREEPKSCSASSKGEVSSGIGSSVSCDSVNTTENTSRPYIPEFKVVSPHSGSVIKLPRYRATPSKYTPRRFQKNRRDSSNNRQQSPVITQVMKNVRASLSEVEIVEEMTSRFSPPLSSTQHHASVVDPSITFAPPLSSTCHNLLIENNTSLSDSTFTPGVYSDRKAHQVHEPDSPGNVTCSPFSSVSLAGEKKKGVLKQLQNICTPKSKSSNKKPTIHPTSPFLDILNDKTPSPVRAIQTKEVSRKNNHQMTVRLNKASRLRLLSPTVSNPPKNKRRKINLTQSSLFEDENDLAAPPPTQHTRPKRVTTRNQKGNPGKVTKRRRSGISIRGIRSIIARQLK